MKIPYIFIAAGLLLINTLAVCGPVTDKEVADLSVRIGAVDKVEQLYSIRYAVGKYAARTDLSLRQQQLLMNSMKMLADEFKIRSHYRNATDVYKEYLDYNNKYLISYNAFAKDSLAAIQKKIAESESAEIKLLDSEIAELSKTQAAVSGLKSNYYSVGGFGAAAIIIITLLLIFSKNRAINQAETQINANREKLKALNKDTTAADMIEGSVAFCRETASVNAQVIESVIELVNKQEDKKLFQKEIICLQHAVSKLNSIVS